MITGAERLTGLFDATRAAGRLAFLPYLTAGLPDPASSVSLFEAMDAADGFEVGIPYSDPLMDGPVIQEAGRRALAAGTTFDRGLEIVAAVRERTGKPVVVMTYVNVVHSRGAERFAAEIAAAGADGLIMADISLEEALPLKAEVEGAGIGMVLFAAPTTDDERLDRIAAAEPVFIYGVNDMGVTGERDDETIRGVALAGRVRARTDVPLVMGVGISRPQQVSALRGTADGVIIGSAIVRRVLEAPTPQAAAESLRTYTDEIAPAL
ncbi:MAG: tryptophan synthase subunit alpha [Acidimicrobiia bacterium]